MTERQTTDAAAPEDPVEVARARVRAELDDPEFREALSKKHHPGHLDAVDRWERVHAEAFGEVPEPVHELDVGDDGQPKGGVEVEPEDGPDSLSDEDRRQRVDGQLLRAEWGRDTDARLQRARDVVGRIWGDAAGKVISSSAGNNLEFIKQMDELAQLDERGRPAVAVAREVLQSVRDRDDARLQLERMKSDPQLARTLTSRNAPGHDEAVLRWKLLHRIAHNA